MIFEPSVHEISEDGCEFLPPPAGIFLILGFFVNHNACDVLGLRRYFSNSVL